MCDCNSRCSMARSDRVIPDGGGSDPFGVRIPMYSGGFGNPVLGNVRAEPSSTIPTIRTPAALSPPQYMTASPAGAALAGSTSGMPATNFLKEHWMWLVVAGLVVAAVVVK
jgi:hypothetical protein